MEVSEYKSLQKKTGLKNRELALELGVTEDTIVKRKGGRSPINREAELAIKYIIEVKNVNTDNK